MTAASVRYRTRQRSRPASACKSATSSAIRAEAAAAWQLPSLVKAVSIVTSGRLRTSLGLFDPRRQQVRLARFLDGAPAALYREVVLHELAHAAVHLVHGRGVRPHGAQWRRFMKAVGLQPRVRLPHGDVKAQLPTGWPRRRVGWMHRCPVCQNSRIAGRPVRRWRCASCVVAGLPGKLVIARIAPSN